MLKLAPVNRFGIATPSLLIHCNFFLQFVLLYVVNMQLTEYASVFLCSLHAEMTGTQILQGRCNLTSEIVGNRLHKCGLCLPGGSQQRLWFAQHFGGKLIGQDGRSIVGNKNFKPLCMWCVA